jgi:hypothetical protein
MLNAIVSIKIFIGLLRKRERWGDWYAEEQGTQGLVMKIIIF